MRGPTKSCENVLQEINSKMSEELSVGREYTHWHLQICLAFNPPSSPPPPQPPPDQTPVGLQARLSHSLKLVFCLVFLYFIFHTESTMVSPSLRFYFVKQRKH